MYKNMETHSSTIDYQHRHGGTPVIGGGAAVDGEKSVFDGALVVLEGLWVMVSTHNLFVLRVRSVQKHDFLRVGQQLDRD